MQPVQQTTESERVVQLASEDGAHVTCAVFFEPSSSDTCPITAEPLAVNCLEGCEALAVFEDAPALTAVRLECAHAFNAMALLYHWMGARMRCPVCRRGADARLATAGLAGAWAAWCRGRVLDSLKGDALRALHEDERVAQQLMQELGVNAVLIGDTEVVIELAAAYGGGSSLHAIVPPQTVVAVAALVYLYITDTDGLTRATRCANLMLWHEDEHRFVARAACVRALSRTLRDVAPALVSFCTVAHHAGGDFELLAQTPPLSLSNLGTVTEIPDTVRGARYTIEYTDGALRALSCELSALW